MLCATVADRHLMNEKSGYLILFCIVSTERFIFHIISSEKRRNASGSHFDEDEENQKDLSDGEWKKVFELLACGEWNMHCVHISN